MMPQQDLTERIKAIKAAEKKPARKKKVEKVEEEKPPVLPEDIVKQVKMLSLCAYSGLGLAVFLLIFELIRLCLRF